MHCRASYAASGAFGQLGLRLRKACRCDGQSSFGCEWVPRLTRERVTGVPLYRSLTKLFAARRDVRSPAGCGNSRRHIERQQPQQTRRPRSRYWFFPAGGSCWQGAAIRSVRVAVIQARFCEASTAPHCLVVQRKLNHRQASMDWSTFFHKAEWRNPSHRPRVCQSHCRSEGAPVDCRDPFGVAPHRQTSREIFPLETVSVDPMS